jgi:hypothetical protein
MTLTRCKKTYRVDVLLILESVADEYCSERRATQGALQWHDISCLYGSCTLLISPSAQEVIELLRLRLESAGKEDALIREQLDAKEASLQLVREQSAQLQTAHTADQELLRLRAGELVQASEYGHLFILVDV